RQLCCGNALFICSVQFSIPDILHHRTGEQIGILKYNPQGTAEIAFPDLVNVNPVIADLAVSDIVKTVEQVCDSRFACAGGSYKSYLLPRFRIERNIMKYGLSRFISKVYLMQPHVPLQFGISYCAGFPMGMFPGPQSGPLLGFLK